LLLGNILLDPGIEHLQNAPEDVFTLWRNREHIEIEATIIFDQFAKDLKELWGERDSLAALSLRSSHDELRHAKRCQEILSYGKNCPAPLSPHYKIQFGPADLDLRKRVQYTALGVCCITETLSAALLIEMHKRARPKLIKETIHEILVDEVDHGRLGWAELSRQAHKHDLSWLLVYLEKLVDEAFSSEITPMLGVSQDLAPWGILSEKDARPIMQETLKMVIYPGLAQLGIKLL